MADSARIVSVRIALEGGKEVEAKLAAVGETGQREMDRIARSAEGASHALRLLGPVMAGLSVGGLVAMARSAVAVVGNFGELADAAGVSVAALQGFQYVATQVGISNDELQRSLQALTRRIADAATGEEQAQRAFRRLGVEFRDTAGNARATESVIAELADRVGKMSDPAERAAAATALFGDRLGQRMIPFLAMGRDAIEEFIANALRFGAIASDEIVAKADEASDKIAALEHSFSSLARNLLARVAPALTAVADGLNRVILGASIAERRASLEQTRAALQSRLAVLEAEQAGQASLYAQPRRGTIQQGAVGVARGQAGVARADIIAEIRQQIEELNRELAGLDAEARAAEERARRILEPETRAGGGDAVARRWRAEEDIARLRESLDARLRIENEFRRQLARINEAERVGAIDAAEAQRLVAQATAQRGQALQRLVGTTQRANEEDREQAAILRERERLIRQNENAYERYQRRMENLANVADRAAAIGMPLPETTIIREAEAALSELENAQRRNSDAARELGLTFSSAFEDAIIRGEKLSKVLQGLLQDIARIIARKTITEPLGNWFSASLSSSDSSTWLGALFRLIGSAGGNVFDRTGLVPFARGGIVTRPTVFPFAAGVGLMGEAGPEAIMPLRRTPDGRLGVEAMGGRGTVVNQTINVTVSGGGDAGDVAEQQRLAREIGRLARAGVLEAIKEQRRAGGMLWREG